jgi:hypothetical protein
MPDDSLWPDGKKFAFTVFDDTDKGTLENLRPVYALLQDLGFRTTKSCWSFRGDPNLGRFPGDTLDDPEYRRWLLELQAQGFEIGWHSATWHGSKHDRMSAALERFFEVFGHYPLTATNHASNEGSIYWGSYRLSGWRRTLYNLVTHFHNTNIFRGHQEGDEYFWGDLCREKIKYFRNFVYQDINTLKACPYMPYYDPERPYVNHWFASSNGCDVATFNRCLSEKRLDRLEAEGGACVMYTHFANDFFKNGVLNERFRETMTGLSKRSGWFVPVGTLLDYLLQKNNRHVLSVAERRKLERKWFFEKIFIGSN